MAVATGMYRGPVPDMQTCEQSILSFNTLCGVKAALSATTQQDNEVTCPDCRRIIDAVGVNFANQADDRSR